MEYIEREELYKQVQSAYVTAERCGFELGKDVVLLAIKQQPAADVVEVRHGRWEQVGSIRMSIKGYKVFNPDWTCLGMKYEVGQTYKHDGPISICKAGFHFCRKVADCFSYYSFDPQNKVAEIEAIGLVESDSTKSVTNEIKILREIPWAEMLELANEGKGNAGLRNTGDWNTGNRNTGDCNTGNRNTGDGNTGNRNTGNWNTGNWNTGNWNTGDGNTGDWNTGDGNTGFFSTITPKISLFEKPTDMTYPEVLSIPGIQVLNQAYENNWWIYSDDMTYEEKAAHPEHETTGGYLKSIPFKDACALMWKNLSDNDKRKVLEIPNFDADIFYRITGIRLGGQDDV